MCGLLFMVYFLHLRAFRLQSYEYLSVRASVLAICTRKISIFRCYTGRLLHFGVGERQQLKGYVGAGAGIVHGVVMAEGVEAQIGGHRVELVVGQTASEHPLRGCAGAEKPIVGMRHIEML